MAYNKVLVAVDLTEEADEVLAAARTLADEQTAKLSVVTVIKPFTQVYGGLDLAPTAGSPLAFEDEAVRQAQEQLTRLCAGHKIAGQDVLVRLGAPATEIRALAEELQAELIVIGTHGKHGLGLLLGSTANAVLHGVQCDVLAVKIHPLKAKK